MEAQFRGKNRDGQFVFGDLLNFDTYTSIFAKNGNRTIFEVDPATVGQFTGLRDAKGVEIYEGDIVRAASGTIYEVIFEQGAYRVKGKKSKLLLVEGRFYEVINNVHDAPELLGAKPSC